MSTPPIAPQPVIAPHERARVIFFSDSCQCGAPKRKSPVRMLCGVCMSRLPRKLANSFREIELAGALLEIYDEALTILKAAH